MREGQPSLTSTEGSLVCSPGGLLCSPQRPCLETPLFPSRVPLNLGPPSALLSRPTPQPFHSAIQTFTERLLGGGHCFRHLRHNSRQSKVPGSFPGDPVIKAPPANARGAGSIPSQGTKIMQAAWHSLPTPPTQTKPQSSRSLHAGQDGK